MSAVTLTDVVKTYSGGAVLKGASFAVPAGALCAVTGPAGAGASTLLRLIAGLERPTSGEIAIGETPLRSFGTAIPGLAVMVAPDDLKPRANLYANIVRGLPRFGAEGRASEARALALADALGLGPLLARRARDVSTSARVLAALAQALARRPGAIVVDGALAALGSEDRARAVAALRAHLAETGAVAVVAARPGDEILRSADLQVALDAGEVLQVGAPDDLYRRPADVRVARLTGPAGMNVLPVRANQTGLSLEDGTWLGAASVMTSKTHGLLGVRPERLFPIGEGLPPENGARLPVDVTAVSRLGAETWIEGLVGGVPVAARFGAAAPDDLAPGARLILGAERRDLHMFDAVTDARV